MLVVEPDRRSGARLAQLLREDGFDVEMVVDGSAALRRLDERPLFDVLVTELYVPHVDGLTVARKAIDTRRGMATILLTGHPQHASAHASLLCPPALVVTKPVDVDALARAIHALLEAPSGP